MFSVRDLLQLHDMCAPHLPIVFDFHHWRFCTGAQGLLSRWWQIIVGACAVMQAENCSISYRCCWHASANGATSDECALH